MGTGTVDDRGGSEAPSTPGDPETDVTTTLGHPPPSSPRTDLETNDTSP